MRSQKGNRILCIWALTILLFGIPAGISAASYKAIGGVLNLNGWRPDSDGPVRLDGNWFFYRHRLHSPADFRKASVAAAAKFYTVPGIWNKTSALWKNASGRGYATYRLLIRNLPPNITDYCLKLPDMPTAYRLWVNGVLVAANGSVGKNKKTASPWFLPRVVRLHDINSEIELVIQVSNFHHRDGGIWHSLILGSMADDFRLRELPLLFDVFLFGGLLIMGMYQIALFVLRPQERAPFYFGIFCLLVGARSLLVGQRIIYALFSSLDFIFLQRLEFILLFMSAPAFCLFFYHLFPVETHRRFHRSVVAANILLIIVVLIFPLRVFAVTGDIFQITMIPIVVYIVLTVKKAILARREGGWLFAGGFLLLLIAIVNDTLYTQMVIQTRPLAHLGVFFFIFFQALLISKNFAGAFSKIAEITEELKTKNTALQRVDKLKDDFLANTSHELKTPLHGIMGIAEAMADGAAGKLTAIQKRNLEMIASSGKRLFNLINDLLDFSKIRNNDLQLTMKPVDLRTIIDLVVTFSRPMIYNKPLLIVTHLPENMPLVLADENRLQQILFNLLTNAVKFTASGEVRVSAIHTNETVCVSVSDTGIGIAANDKTRIFQEFEQIDGGTERPFQGMGLGLAICHRLAKLHGSDIQMQSEPGKGSTFSFTLKTAPAGSALEKKQRHESLRTHFIDGMPMDETAVAPQTEPQPTTFSGKRILVVDDEPVNLQMIYNHLTIAGFHVTTALDGVDALAQLSAEIPDAVLLDIMMPHMSGFEVCRRIRKTHSFYNLPVIMLTVRNRVTDLVQGLESGANDYLTKPFHHKELLARLNAHLEARESVGRLKQNLQLKTEINRRKIVEKELKRSKRRLVRILDSADTAIVALNDTGIIIFFNQEAETQFGYSTNEVLHQPFDILFPDSEAETIRRFLTASTGSNQPKERQLREGIQVTARKNDGAAFKTDVTLSAFSIGNMRHCTMIFGRPPQTTVKTTVSLHEKGLLEHAVADVSNYLSIEKGDDPVALRDIDPALDALDERLAMKNGEQHTRELLVETMTTALYFWESGTGKSKIALAEESKIWKAYLDGSTWKTRTMDKYLRLKTLPKKPRWREVLRTANFVLKNTNLGDIEKKTLMRLVTDLEHALHRN